MTQVALIIPFKVVSDLHVEDVGQALTMPVPAIEDFNQKL
jgi:hypothetical protein